MITRLEIMSKPLSDKLEVSNKAQQVNAGLIACELALKHALPENKAVFELLNDLKNEKDFSQEKLNFLDNLLNEYEDKYFELQNSTDPRDLEESLIYFSKARAISSLIFLATGNDFQKITEGIYEAIMAVDDEGLIVNSIDQYLLIPS